MQPDQPDYDQPVAYDKDGNPLYAHPPKRQDAEMTHQVDPVEPEVSPETKRRHEESVSRYPSLNLSKEEYIISEVRRHPIGLVLPITIGSVLVLAVLGVLSMYSTFVPSGNPPLSSVLMPALLLILLIVLGAYIVVMTYLGNKFYLTNESVIQEIQTSLLARREQTVSLSNIEDASYTQTGIFQLLFNYGSIRLSTEGDETTYHFNYVSNPKHEIATLNNAVEAFKNGRPVGTD
jgi:uncharacterized membrane protein YdbT with pleckstrin-like domain